MHHYVHETYSMLLLFSSRCLVKLIGERQCDWDEYLDPVLFSIRTSVQESIKFTPFFLMHGREARYPLEAEKASYQYLFPDIQERVNSMTKIKDSLFPIAKKNIDESQRRQKKQYRKRKGIAKTNVSPGDSVLRLNMIKRTKKGHKTEDTWLGPYKVLTISDSGSCLLQCIKTGKRLKQKLNISQLKLYQSSKVDKEELKDEGRTPNKPMDKEGKKKSNKVLPSKVDEKEVKDKQGAPAITFEGEKDKKKSSKEMLQILEDQLLDDAVLRLWRTGANFKQWNGKEDDQTNVRCFTF